MVDNQQTVALIADDWTARPVAPLLLAGTTGVISHLITWSWECKLVAQKPVRPEWREETSAGDSRWDSNPAV